MKARQKHRQDAKERPVYRHHAFALGAMTTAIISVLLWVLSDALPLTSLKDRAIDAVPAIGTLLIALLSLFMSYSALSEQRRARQASTDPVILVHFGSREDAPSMITLEISNVGAGAALDISVSIDPVVVGQLLDKETIITDFREVTGPIRTIPQDRRVSYNFGMGYKLVAEPTIPPIRVIVQYQDIDGGKYESEQWLDVRELRWQRADKPPSARSAIALEDMAKSLKKVVSSSHEFFVVSQPYTEHRVQEEERYEDMHKRFQRTIENQTE